MAECSRPLSAICVTFSPSKKKRSAIPGGTSPFTNDCHWSCSTESRLSYLSPALLLTSSSSDMPSFEARQDLLTTYSARSPPELIWNVTCTKVRLSGSPCACHYIDG